MPDPRFFQALGPISLQTLARIAGAQIAPGGDDIAIAEAAPLNRAGPDGVAFAAGKKWLADLAVTRAGACFVPEALVDQLPAGCIALVTRYPQAAWALAANALHQPILQDAREAAIHPTASIEDGAIVAPGAVIGAEARIGAGTHIGAGAVIGPGVSIGRNARIGPRTSVAFAMLGDGVALLAGAVIGEAGFGAAGGPTGVVDMPQLGRVIIQDNVTVGANSCIDRGAYEDTVIGENTKIDNMVHIAHNVRIGRNCVLAAFTGLSGSITVGDGVAFGGKAGIADHVMIGDGASIGAGAGVIKDVPPGEIWSGYPAKPVREWLRETAWLARAARRKG